jgi:DNA-directed RNA polymerase subunit omega
MLDQLKEETVVNKVGGRFRLSSLVQKRMKMLNQGDMPLIEPEGRTLMEVVLEEIMQSKVFLDEAGEVLTADDASAADSMEQDD